MNKLINDIRSLAILAARRRISVNEFEKRLRALLDSSNVKKQARENLAQMARERFKWYKDRVYSERELIDVVKVLEVGANQFAKTRRGIVKDYVNIVTEGIARDIPARDMLLAITLKTNTAYNHADAIVRTGIAAVGRVGTFIQAERAGINKFRYSRNPAEREFCRKMVALSAQGKTYTRGEINRLDNGQGLPVWSHGGGFRCVHRFIAVVE